MPNYGHLSLSCAKIERPSPLEKPPCKVRLFAQNRSREYRKKLPLQLRPKPLFIAFFSLSHKRPTFAFTPESGYTLGFRRKIAHNGSHGETGGLPAIGHSAVLCRQRNSFYSTTLLYTYISRFSVNPHYQQREKSGETAAINFIPNRFSSHFSTSRTNGPHSLSQMKAGTPSAFGERLHTTAYTPKQEPSLPRPQHSLELPAKSSPKEQPEEADARLWRVSASSGVAAPLGCVNSLFHV